LPLCTFEVVGLVSICNRASCSRTLSLWIQFYILKRS
jgi:hypothetical protein